jgi:hypothetical protein
LLIALAFLSLPALASAQIVIGPNSRLLWTDPLTPLAIAQTFGVAATVDAAATPLVLTPIVCVLDPAVATISDCSTPASQIPLGSHTITVVNIDGALTSAPLAPFSYVTMLIPIPQGLRIARRGYWGHRYWAIG